MNQLEMVKNYLYKKGVSRETLNNIKTLLEAIEFIKKNI